MRPTLRRLVVSATLAAPLLLAGAANAYTIQLTEENCVEVVPPSAQYNNGDPTTDPGYTKVNNCSK